MEDLKIEVEVEAHANVKHNPEALIWRIKQACQIEGVISVVSVEITKVKSYAPYKRG